MSGGRVYDDVITFSNKALAKLSNVTYTFTYDKDLCIGSKIKLNLPSWSGTASSVSIANGCGSSKFTVQDTPGYCEDATKSNVSSCSLSSNMWRKEVIITVVSRPLIHDTQCALMISGLQTPASKRFTRIYQVSQSFDLTLCSYDGTPEIHLTTIDEVNKPEVEIHYFNFTSLEQQLGTSMTYKFSINRKLHIGDKIEFRLPGWSGLPVTTKTYCGDAAFVLDTNFASANAHLWM